MEPRRSLRRRARIRLLAPMVALAVVAAACGGGSSSNPATGKSDDAADLPTCPVHALDGVTQPVEIKLWHFLSGKTGDTLKALADTYNASQSKVKVDVESQGTSNDELFKKYQAGMASKDLPAIAVMDDTVTQQVIDSKTVIPATSCIEADNYDMSEFLQTGMDYYTVDGVLWPASINLSGALLYYNQGHFQQAGLDPKQTPKTLDEVRDVRPEDQGRPHRRRPGTGRPEGQLAAHRDVADRRRGSDREQRQRPRHGHDRRRPRSTTTPPGSSTPGSSRCRTTGC